MLTFFFATAAAIVAPAPTQLHGSYVFRPPATTPPKAVCLFLGGAAVGAAPQLFYEGMCSKLAASGYVVLATPFELQFDYLEVCEKILSTAEPAHAALTAKQETLRRMQYTVASIMSQLGQPAAESWDGAQDAPSAAEVEQAPKQMQSALRKLLDVAAQNQRQPRAAR